MFFLFLLYFKHILDTFFFYTESQIVDKHRYLPPHKVKPPGLIPPVEHFTLIPLNIIVK